METWLVVRTLVVLGLGAGAVCVLWIRWARELGRVGPGGLPVRFAAPPGGGGDDAADARFALGVADLVEQVQRGAVDVARSGNRWRLTEGHPVPTSATVRRVLASPRGSGRRFWSTEVLAEHLERAVEAEAGRGPARLARAGGSARRPDSPSLLILLVLPLLSVLPYTPVPDTVDLFVAAALSSLALLAVLLLSRAAVARWEEAARRRAVPSREQVTARETGRLRRGLGATLPHLTYLRVLREPGSEDELRELVLAHGNGDDDHDRDLALADLAAGLGAAQRVRTEERRLEAERRERRRRRRERAEFELGWRRWEERNGREVTEDEYRRELRLEEERRKREAEREAARRRRVYGGGGGGA